MIHRKLHILLPLLFCWQLSQAQVSSLNGNFEVDNATGCAPLTVNVTDLSGSSATILYNYDYLNNNGAGGFGFSNTTDTTYTTPGEYLLVQIIQGVTSNTYDSIRIVVRPADPPPFLIKTCINHQATVEIDPLFYDSLQISYTLTDTYIIGANETPPIFTYTPGPQEITVRGLINNGADNCGESTQPFETINNLVPGQIQRVAVVTSDVQNGEIEIGFDLAPNVLYELEISENSDNNFNSAGIFQFPDNFLLNDTLNTVDNQYCFRFTAINDCDPSQNLPGQVVCSTDLTVESLPNQVQLEWNLFSADVDSYLVFRNNLPLAIINDANQKNYLDTAIECNQTYCYQVEAVYNFPAISQSIETCVAAISDDIPPAIENITATIVNNGIEVSWPAPPGISDPDYQVYRSLNGGAFQLVGGIAATNFLDIVAIDTARKYCYQINYLDACGNLSDSSIQVCPIYLSTITDNDNFYITWNEYSGWTNGVQYYEVLLLNENGQVLETTDVDTNTEFQVVNLPGDPQIKYFIVIGYSDFGAETRSNIIRVEDKSHVFFPNAFTPDGDGLNDVFTAQGRYLETYELRIFNRWGEMIFISNQQDEGWNGTYNGIEVPQGSYAFSATIVDNLGNDLSTAGTVFLLRNNR